MKISNLSGSGKDIAEPGVFIVWQTLKRGLSKILGLLKNFQNCVDKSKKSVIMFLASQNCGNGGMADAHGSGPCVGNNMRVQVPFSARTDSSPEVISGEFLSYTESYGIGMREKGDTSYGKSNLSGQL